MSNLILSIEMLFSELFQDVTTSFTGKYVNKNEELKKIIDEIQDEEIPSAKNDRANLKNDASKVAGDYKKAFELKKLEY